MPRADEHGVEELFRARYLEMVRLAGLLGADDPEDIAQEGGRQLAAATTVAAGWPGSSLRLWHVRLPLSAEGTTFRVSATAYDAAGHVLGQVKLGQMS